MCGKPYGPSSPSRTPPIPHCRTEGPADTDRSAVPGGGDIAGCAAARLIRPTVRVPAVVVGAQIVGWISRRRIHRRVRRGCRVIAGCAAARLVRPVVRSVVIVGWISRRRIHRRVRWGRRAIAGCAAARLIRPTVRVPAVVVVIVGWISRRRIHQRVRWGCRAIAGCAAARLVRPVARVWVGPDHGQPQSCITTAVSDRGPDRIPRRISLGHPG